VIGYPAMIVPCALSENLPVGIMLVGRKWSETTLLRDARAFEATETYDAIRPEGIKSAG
jgi:amidase